MKETCFDGEKNTWSINLKYFWRKAAGNRIQWSDHTYMFPERTGKFMAATYLHSVFRSIVFWAYWICFGRQMECPGISKNIYCHFWWVHYAFIMLGVYWHCCSPLVVPVIRGEDGHPWLLLFSLFCLSSFGSCYVFYQQFPTPIFSCCSPFSSHSFQISLNTVLPSHSRSSSPPLPLHFLGICSV